MIAGAALLLLQTLAPPPAAPYAMPGEEAVEPYAVSPDNAGARPFDGDGMARAFGGRDGIDRVVADLIVRAYDDPVIGPIFEGHDRVRLHRTLHEQFCYILNAGCTYTGRDMLSTHRDLGTQQRDMNRLVELLQASMREQRIPFAAQNRFLAKLAPMRRDVVER